MLLSFESVIQLNNVENSFNKITRFMQLSLKLKMNEKHNCFIEKEFHVLSRLSYDILIVTSILTFVATIINLFH